MRHGPHLAPFLRLASCLSLTLVAALGFDGNALQPEGYVSDFAHVLQPDARASLERYCGQVEQATGVQIAIVTVDTLDGQPIEDVASALFHKWGVGKKGKDEGVMLLLAIKDRKDRVEVGYGLEPNLPDGFVGSVLRDMRPLMKEDQYGQAMLVAAQSMGSRIAAAKGVTLDVPLRETSRDPIRIPKFPWQLIFFGIVFLVWLFSRMGGRGGGGGIGGFLTGMFLGNLLGGGWGGRGGFGGGGFGGSSDSGGGFGGFGGGDSGGGGASSDW